MLILVYASTLTNHRFWPVVNDQMSNLSQSSRSTAVKRDREWTPEHYILRVGWKGLLNHNRLGAEAIKHLAEIIVSKQKSPKNSCSHSGKHNKPLLTYHPYSPLLVSHLSGIYQDSPTLFQSQAIFTNKERKSPEREFCLVFNTKCGDMTRQNQALYYCTLVLKMQHETAL